MSRTMETVEIDAFFAAIYTISETMTAARRLEEAAAELCAAVSAYFDPENQYTASREHAVLVAKKATLDAIDGLDQSATT